LWLACRGGFRFNPKSDDFEAILDWLKYHVEVIKQDRKEAKPEAVAPPPAAAAAAAPVEAFQSLSLSDDN
jgi:hypothetical protein